MTDFKILVCGVLAYYLWPPLLIQIDSFNTSCFVQFVLGERATSSYCIGDCVSFIVREETHSTPVRNRTVSLRKLLVVGSY